MPMLQTGSQMVKRKEQDRDDVQDKRDFICLLLKIA
jgi:hypothetical protein